MNNARKKGGSLIGWIIIGIMVVLFVVGKLSIAYMGSSYYTKGRQAHNSGNYRTAAKYYKKACGLGNTAGCYSLGYLHAKGYGVPQNYSAAIKYFKKACDGGNAVENAAGCYSLGILYDEGKGVTQSLSTAAKLYKKATKIYKKACDDGDTEECIDLGNYKKVAKIYKKACDSGNAKGCSKLADLYAYGRGVKMNRIKAYKYYMIAAKKGNTIAQRHLDSLCRISPWACK